MAEEYVTLLRIKRNRDDAVQETFVVEGLSERPGKRAATNEAFRCLKLADDRVAFQNFTHIASLPSDKLDWLASQQKLACLLQDSRQRELSSSHGTASPGEHPKYRIFDVERPLPATSTDSNAGNSCDSNRKWQARPAASQGQDPDRYTNEVYDIYAQSKGSSIEADWHQAPIVSVHDKLMFEDELSGSGDEDNGSDNPDEEGHYTHDYPDEQDVSSDDSSRERSNKSSESSEEEPDC